MWHQSTHPTSVDENDNLTYSYQLWKWKSWNFIVAFIFIYLMASKAKHFYVYSPFLLFFHQFLSLSLLFYHVEDFSYWVVRTIYILIILTLGSLFTVYFLKGNLLEINRV